MENGKRAIGLCGSDTPIAVLSDARTINLQSILSNFAQVTNLPWWYLAEEIITDIRSIPR